MTREFRASDKGLRVVTAGGEEIGTVEAVDDEVAHVKPEQSLSDSIRQRLGWTSEDEDVFELHHETIDQITDTEVRLKQ